MPRHVRRRNPHDMTAREAQDALDAYGESIARNLRYLHEEQREVARKIRLGEAAWKAWDVDNLYHTGLVSDKEAMHLDEILSVLRGA